jgi:hypothetical protein
VDNDADGQSLAQHLRGVSDGLLQAIRAVSTRETQKRGVSPGDPRFPELARAVRVAAAELLDLANAEAEAALRTNQGPGSAALTPIAEVEPRADLASILFDWRAVERQLEATEAGSAEAMRLLLRYEAIRDEYQRAIATRSPVDPADR